MTDPVAEHTSKLSLGICYTRKHIPDINGVHAIDLCFCHCCQSSITYLDGEHGILRYRGYPVEELIRSDNVGVAAMAWLSGAQPMLLEHSNATLKLNADGSATLLVAPGRMGQGIEGALAQVAAEVLTLPYEKINVLAGDTDATGFDIGTHASRGAYCIGKATLAAATKAKEELLQRAAEKMEEPLAALELKDGQISSTTNPEKSMSLEDVAMDLIYSYNKDCHQIVAQATVEPNEFAPPWQAMPLLFPKLVR